MKKERRGGKRYESRVPFFILWSCRKKKRLKLWTVTKDIGDKGVSFTAGKDFSVSFPVELQFLHPLQKRRMKALRLKGKIVWTRSIGAGIFKSGVCFVKLSSYDHQRIAKYFGPSIGNKKQQGKTH